MTSTDVDHQAYRAQLDEKTTRLKSTFEHLEMPQLEVLDSPPLNYRMRAEFRVWHDDEDLYYIMFDPATKDKYRVDELPAASQRINEAMPVLIEAIRTNRTLRRKLFQIDFLSTLSGELIASLLYHRPLDDEWTQAAKILKQELIESGISLDLIGRARKMKYCLDRDYVIERLQVGEKTLIYQQYENTFTQPNAVVAQKMLQWSIDCTEGSTGDLLELYCGNGHFSLALSENFNQVLATELAKTSVKAAQYNIAANHIQNVQIARLSAMEVAEAIEGRRTFRRLKNAGIDLSQYDFKTVFVDPPRAGMDTESCKMVQRFERILYISCNPSTLRDNLDTLCQTHTVTRFALFDQFPYTSHIEAGVLLERT